MKVMGVSNDEMIVSRLIPIDTGCHFSHCKIHTVVLEIVKSEWFEYYRALLFQSTALS